MLRLLRIWVLLLQGLGAGGAGAGGRRARLRVRRSRREGKLELLVSGLAVECAAEEVLLGAVLHEKKRRVLITEAEEGARGDGRRHLGPDGLRFAAARRGAVCLVKLGVG